MRDADREKAEARESVRIGEFVKAIDEGAWVSGLEEGVLTGFSVRLPTEIEPSTLLVLKADAEGVGFVAFVGAYSLGDALLAWRARAAAGKMKWRENVPWGERAGP